MEVFVFTARRKKRLIILISNQIFQSETHLNTCGQSFDFLINDVMSYTEKIYYLYTAEIGTDRRIKILKILGYL